MSWFKKRNWNKWVDLTTGELVGLNECYLLQVREDTDDGTKQFRTIRISSGTYDRDTPIVNEIHTVLKTVET